MYRTPTKCGLVSRLKRRRLPDQGSLLTWLTRRLHRSMSKSRVRSSKESMPRKKARRSASAMVFPHPRTIESHARPITDNWRRGTTERRRDSRVEQGRPFQNGTRRLKTKHEARCPRTLADPRQKLSGAEVGFEVPY